MSQEDIQLGDQGQPALDPALQAQPDAAPAPSYDDQHKDPVEKIPAIPAGGISETGEPLRSTNIHQPQARSEKTFATPATKSIEEQPHIALTGEQTNIVNRAKPKGDAEAVKRSGGNWL